MESGLTPREIQERIRAGQSLDEVTEVAGMPRDRVERFALAVFDERRHMADQARTHSVRRTGESGSHRELGTVVDGWFDNHEVDPETVTWDATRGEDRFKWTITVSWGNDDIAEFDYDVRGAFTTAGNDAAGELIGDDGSVEVSDEEPGDSDNEPTLNYADQFAIVNVIQDEDELAAVEPAGPAADAADVSDASDDADDPGQTVTGPFDLHDIVPTPESELDALYAMLRGHQEDSVNIYAGLSETDPAPPTSRRRRRNRRGTDEDATPETPQAEQPTPAASPEPTPDPDQPTLIEAGEDEPPPAPAKKRPRRRAAVPSWDEIMFGGPDKD